MKPKSHPLRLVSDAFHAESSSESATAEDDGLWDAIKKASFDALEGSDDTAPAEPIPIFANVFSDETIRLLSLIPGDAPDKDKSAPTFALRSPVSPGGPRSFPLPETPLLVQSERGRPPPSGHAIVAPGLSANNSTAPTTAAPETPSDWLQFSNQGFGTIPGSRDLAAKLWDDDVEKTVPPPAPLSRKSSRRAPSRHSSLDDAKTPVQPVPPTPAPPVSRVTLVAKVKLDEAFIDFWADSLLDPISKRWPRFVLCQLKPFSPADASATPTPVWLVIEQRFVRPPPVSPVKEEAEVTVPPARPRASSPRPSARAESSRLSAAFSIVSKKRFGLFTGGNGDSKSPKDKTARLPQVGEYGEVVRETEEDTVATEKPVEIEAKDNVDGGAAPAITDAVVPVAIGVSAAVVASAAEEVTPKEDDVPIATAVSAPSELADISAPKADAPVKDESPHGATSQNGHANDDHHNEEQREPEAETAATQGPAGDNDAVILPMTSEPIKTEAEPAVSGVEAEPTQSEPESVPAAPYSADLVPVIVDDPPAAELEPVSTDDTAPAIQTISTDEGQATDSADAVETTVPFEEPTPVVGEVIVEDVQPVAISERNLDERDAEAATPEPETIPASVAGDTTSPSLEHAECAAAQAAPEEPSPSAEPDAEHDAFVTQSVEEGLSSQATPQIQDPVIDEQPPSEETTPIPIPDTSASESIPAENLATSHEDEAVTAPPESAVADGMPLDIRVLRCVLTAYLDTPVTGPVPDGASAPSENSPPEVPVTEPVPEPELSTPFAHDSTQSPTNDSMEPNVAHAEQVDAGEPDTVVIAAEDASIANLVNEDVSELKVDADTVAEEAQATSKESENAIVTEEAPASVTEIPTFVIEEPAPPTEAEIPVEAPAPVVQETDATTEEATPAAAETPAPTLEPATDVPAIEVTASEVAETDVEASAPAPVEPDVPEEVVPVAADTLAVEPATAIGETTPSVEDVLSVHDHTLAAEQSIAVPEEPPHLPEETASATAEPLVEPTHMPEEPALVTEAAPPAATEAPAEPAPATEEAAPTTTEAPAEPTSVSEEPAPDDEAATSATIEAPAESAPVTEEAAPTTTEALAEPTSVSEEPAPIDEAAAPTTIEAPAEPALVTEEAAPATTEAPADPACVLEETAPDAEAVAPATETPPLEQFTPDLDVTPAPPDEPAPVQEEDEPTVPEPPVEEPGPVPEDPAPTTESAAPTADDTPAAECVEEGAEGPSAESAAAEGLEEATVGAEPAAEEEPVAISSSETPAIAAQESPSVEIADASELETPVDASVSDEATDATNAGKIMVSIFPSSCDPYSNFALPCRTKREHERVGRRCSIIGLFGRHLPPFFAMPA